MDKEKIIKGVTQILEGLDADLSLPGLKDTPKRVAETYLKLCGGDEETVEEILGRTFVDEATDELILVKNIDFFSLCEHHLLPFYGRAHIGYIPRDRKVLGLSKVARLVEVYSRKLQLQERMTSQIAHAIDKHLSPWGVGVIIEAKHLCMAARGVEKVNHETTTSCMLGAMRNNYAAREEFISLIKR